MYKYIIIMVLCSNLFSQIVEGDWPRSRYDFTSRQDSIIQRNNYRNEEDLLQFIESTIQTHSIPGLSISVVKEGGIVWEKYFGYANIDENILVDENTMFILSSVSKTVTATALMQ